jgi:hypothetical protein
VPVKGPFSPGLNLHESFQERELSNDARAAYNIWNEAAPGI